MFSDFALIGKKRKQEHLKDIGFEWEILTIRTKLKLLSPDMFWLDL